MASNGFTQTLTNPTTYDSIIDESQIVHEVSIVTRLPNRT